MDTQHNSTQYRHLSDQYQHNNTWHNDTYYKGEQYDDTHHNGTQYNDSLHKELKFDSTEYVFTGHYTERLYS
jgi:hypothetical protein